MGVLEKAQELAGRDTPKSYQNFVLPEDRPQENAKEMPAFLEVVFHKILSPVASIVGYAELLNDPQFRQDEEYLTTCRRVITTQGHQISRFLEDAMTMSRLDAGDYELICEPLRIGPLAEDVIKEMREQTGRNICFDNQASDGFVFGDALRLREILIKLIDNAMKFSPVEKPVIVTIRRVEGYPWLEIAVQDHGFGIDQNERQNLFTRFGRVKNPQTLGIPGNGLGLYIVKKLVELHDGQIELVSQPAAGSTFTVKLPILQNPG